MTMCKSENGHEDRCSCDNCGLEYGDLTAKLRLAVEELKRAGIVLQELSNDDYGMWEDRTAVRAKRRIDTALAKIGEQL